MDHQIGIWFLLISLFFPRFALFFWWITGNLPYNTTPLWADVICSIFLPRVLILVYIYDIQQVSMWFCIHLVTLFISWGWHLTQTQQNWDKLNEAIKKL
jgi:hypothetical protein